MAVYTNSMTTAQSIENEYSEGGQYYTVPVWDIYVRDNTSTPWEKLRTSTVDETSHIAADNRRCGWQAYAISQRTVRC